MNQNAKRRSQAARGLAAQIEEAPPAAPRKAAAETPAPAGRHVFAVDEAAAGERLDRFLARVAAGLSRTRIKALVEAGAVTIDDAPATDAAAKVRAAQEVVIDLPEPVAATPAGEAIPLRVVFEDAHLVIVDKPAGLVVHPAAGHETGTLVNALIAHCGDSLSGVGGVKRPGIVHRLDKDTSGLLVVAKTDAAHQGLAALFADHGRALSLVRDYVAFVWGAPDRPAGTVEAPIGRHPWHREKQAVVREERGRFALTHYDVERVFRRDGKPIVARVRCRLETGRTHQIRVHLAHLGCPVVGDPLYATGFQTKAALLPASARGRVEALHRQALHAASLGFAHPITGEELLFESPLPPDLAALDTALTRMDP